MDNTDQDTHTCPYTCSFTYNLGFTRLLVGATFT